MSASYIGKVGSDEEGRLQISSLASEGVDTAGIIVVEGAESQNAFIIIDQATGERTILWRRDERLTIREEEVDERAVTAGRVLHIDGHDVAASIASARFARARGDSGRARHRQRLRRGRKSSSASRFSDLVQLFSRTGDGRARHSRSVKEITGDFRVADGCRDAGGGGALGYIHDQYVHSPAFKVECLDTTGAGDAFHGGFIYGLLKGFSVEETLRFANAVAALKCRAIGARTALPRIDEVNSLLASAS